MCAMSATPERRIAREWAKKHGVVILDYDGWRTAGAPQLEDPITEKDFLKRMGQSTVLDLKHKSLR
jgi:hypothetical protein